jgi:hypothetical protein
MLHYGLENKRQCVGPLGIPVYKRTKYIYSCVYTSPRDRTPHYGLQKLLTPNPMIREPLLDSAKAFGIAIFAGIVGWLASAGFGVAILPAQVLTAVVVFVCTVIATWAAVAMLRYLHFAYTQYRTVHARDVKHINKCEHLFALFYWAIVHYVGKGEEEGQVLYHRILDELTRDTLLGHELDGIMADMTEQTEQPYEQLKLPTKSKGILREDIEKIMSAYIPIMAGIIEQRDQSIPIAT